MVYQTYKIVVDYIALGIGVSVVMTLTFSVGLACYMALFNEERKEQQLKPFADRKPSS